MLSTFPPQSRRLIAIASSKQDDQCCLYLLLKTGAVPSFKELHPYIVSSSLGRNRNKRNRKTINH